jgi:hypothetical protein
MELLAELKHPRTNWKYILIVVILAFMVSGGILGYQWWVVKEEAKAPGIKRLENEEIMQPEDEKPKQIISKERLLLDQKTWEGMSKGEVHLPIGYHFNLDPPNTTVLYSNPEKGIALFLPYNSAWGTEEFTVPPYYNTVYLHFFEETEGIAFGPVVGWHGGSLPRIFNMEFLPVKAAEEVIALVKEKSQSFPGFGIEEGTITKSKINGLDVVRYVMGDEIQGIIYTIEVVGRKFNYHFWCLCYMMDGEDEALNLLEDIIKTIQFLE